MKHFFIFPLSLLVFLFQTGCQTLNQPEIQFVGDFVLSKKSPAAKTDVGGISGFFYNKKTNKLLAVSDASYSYPRFYELSFDLSKPQFQVLKETPYKSEVGKSIPGGQYDSEAIFQLSNGDIFISSEGVIKKGVPPQIAILSSGGRKKASISLPDITHSTPSQGFYHNAVFEGMSLAQDEKSFFTISERNLKQDQLPNKDQAILRLMHWTWKKTRWEPIAHYPYIYEQDPKGVKQGLTELYHLSDLEFLTLERSWQGKDAFKISVFHTNCQGASNVKNTTAITKKPSQICQKRLIFSPTQYISQFKSHQGIDNLEALTLIQQNGKTYIVIASDDNFRKQQVNQFLVFEWNRK